MLIEYCILFLLNCISPIASIDDQSLI